jgi:hypothetical protein
MFMKYITEISAYVCVCFSFFIRSFSQPLLRTHQDGGFKTLSVVSLSTLFVVNTPSRFHDRICSFAAPRDGRERRDARSIVSFNAP